MTNFFFPLLSPTCWSSMQCVEFSFPAFVLLSLGTNLLRAKANLSVPCCAENDMLERDQLNALWCWSEKRLKKLNLVLLPFRKLQPSWTSAVASSVSSLLGELPFYLLTHATHSLSRPYSSALDSNWPRVWFKCCIYSTYADRHVDSSRTLGLACYRLDCLSCIGSSETDADLLWNMWMIPVSSLCA